jgi:hypothetical protein
VIAEIAPSGLPRVAIAHHHPGRIRLRGPVLEDAPRFADRIGQALAAVDGIERVAHNPASGSLLVEYRPEVIDADGVLERVLEAGLRLDDPPRRSDATHAVVGAARAANAQVSEMTGGAADLHGVVSFVLGAGAVASLVFARGPRAPRWDNLLYWSYTFFREVHLRDLERSRVARATAARGGSR